MKHITKHMIWLELAVFFAILSCAGYAVSRTPAQHLKITAVTQAEEYDMSGMTDIWYMKPMKTGTQYTAVIRFMAVESTSGDLFVKHGSGQYVYMGCSELTGQYSFMSTGCFLHIRLTMGAEEMELKLEDGTPFDITRYSLKPVLTIEEQ